MFFWSPCKSFSNLIPGVTIKSNKFEFVIFTIKIKTNKILNMTDAQQEPVPQDDAANANANGAPAEPADGAAA